MAEQVTIHLIEQPGYVVAHVWRITHNHGKVSRREVAVRRVGQPAGGMAPASLLRALADELEAPLENRYQPAT
jgi:hypothetical protein